MNMDLRDQGVRGEIMKRRVDMMETAVQGHAMKRRVHQQKLSQIG